MVLTKKEILEFEAAARPLLTFLREKCHPHVTVIVTQTNAEILEGSATVTVTAPASGDEVSK